MPGAIPAAPGSGAEGGLVSAASHLAGSEGGPAGRPDQGVPGGEPDLASRRRPRILVVEDDDAVALFSTQLLEELGYAAVRARDGAEALELLAGSAGFDAVFSDVVMPGGVDGREVARHARARQVPCVALMSGWAPGHAPATADVPLLAKPFTIEELAARVRALRGAAA